MRGCRELPGAARNSQKWGVEGTAVSCGELKGKGRNGEREEAAVSCHEVPEIYKSGEMGRGCREVSEIRRNGEKGGAAVSCHEMKDSGRIGWRGETAVS